MDKAAHNDVDLSSDDDGPECGFARHLGEAITELFRRNSEFDVSVKFEDKDCNFEVRVYSKKPDFLSNGSR